MAPFLTGCNIAVTYVLMQLLFYIILYLAAYVVEILYCPEKWWHNNLQKCYPARKESIGSEIIDLHKAEVREEMVVVKILQN